MTITNNCTKPFLVMAQRKSREEIDRDKDNALLQSIAQTVGRIVKRAEKKNSTIRQPTADMIIALAFNMIKALQLFENKPDVWEIFMYHVNRFRL